MYSKLPLFLFLLISFVHSQTYYQIITYKSFDAANSILTIESEITISDTNYLAYNESSLGANLASKKRKIINNQVYAEDSYARSPDNITKKNTFFLLDSNGVHFKNRKYIAWNFTCANGIVTYKIKYFICDAELDTYFQSISNLDKIKNSGDLFIPISSTTPMEINLNCLITKPANTCNFSCTNN